MLSRLAMVTVVLLGSGLAARSASAAAKGCAAEKKGMANAIKMRHAPMALATATFSWAECEEAQFEALKWPAKTDLKKMPKELVKRQQQVQLVRDAYEKAAAANADDPRWKILGAFGTGRAMMALATQVETIPPPKVKGSPEDQETILTAFRDALAEQGAPLRDAALKLYSDGVELAGTSNVGSDEGVQTQLKLVCEVIAKERPTDQHSACGTKPVAKPPVMKPPVVKPPGMKPAPSPSTVKKPPQDVG